MYPSILIVQREIAQAREAKQKEGKGRIFKEDKSLVLA